MRGNTRATPWDNRGVAFCWRRFLVSKATPPVGNTRSAERTPHDSYLPLLLTIDAAAACLSVSRATMWRLVASGFPTVRVNRARRISRAALESYVARLENEQGSA